MPKSALSSSSIRWILPFQNDPKNLDLPCKTDIVVWGSFGRQNSKPHQKVLPHFQEVLFIRLLLFFLERVALFIRRFASVPSDSNLTSRDFR